MKFLEYRNKFLKRKVDDPVFSSSVLLKAVAESEKEFLEFGGGLRRLYGRAEELSKTSSSLVALTEGRRLSGLTERLRDFLDKNGDLGSESRQGTEALQGILDKTSQIGNHLQSFRNVVRTLRVLCNFIKIESIRFGQGENGFHALAEDVGILAKGIEEKSSPVIEQSNSLATLAMENLTRILNFQQSVQDKGKRIAESIMSDLESLRALQDASSQRLGRINDSWEEITKSIGEIVSSLQFHDITRQRIEHVSEALGKLYHGSIHPEHDSGTGFIASLSGGVRKRINREELRDGCALERAQLLHTGEELESATERVRKGMRSISQKIGEISLQARGGAENAEFAGASFFSGLEKEIVGLTAAVNEHAVINKEIASALEQVADAVSKMEGFLKDIVKIGIEMKTIALNAAIHAAHVGEHGMVLGVLAEHIHALSMDTSKRIDSIGSDLHCIFEKAGDLRNCTALVSQKRAEVELQMVEELRRELPLLKELSLEAKEMALHIEAEGAAVAEETRERAEGLRFQEQIIQSIAALVLQIEKECTTIDKIPLQKGDGGKPSGERGNMESLEKNYTMQREREVHQSMLGLRDREDRSLPSPGSVETQNKGKEDGEELGENVELF
ncbi:MAG: methyl-accepting chemotaxis protein [Desulfobacteraceae bacterium]|nr:MAG: methyl-accepting chemotaxis protein [Desulfobacteraceae bacterium]